MKKIILVLTMALSICLLSGCKNEVVSNTFDSLEYEFDEVTLKLKEKSHDDNDFTDFCHTYYGEQEWDYIDYGDSKSVMKENSSQISLNEDGSIQSKRININEDYTNFELYLVEEEDGNYSISSDYVDGAVRVKNATITNLSSEAIDNWYIITTGASGFFGDVAFYKYLAVKAKVSMTVTLGEEVSINGFRKQEGFSFDVSNVPLYVSFRKIGFGHDQTFVQLNFTYKGLLLSQKAVKVEEELSDGENSVFARCSYENGIGFNNIYSTYNYYSTDRSDQPSYQKSGESSNFVKSASTYTISSDNNYVTDSTATITTNSSGKVRCGEVNLPTDNYLYPDLIMENLKGSDYQFSIYDDKGNLLTERESVNSDFCFFENLNIGDSEYIHVEYYLTDPEEGEHSITMTVEDMDWAFVNNSDKLFNVTTIKDDKVTINSKTYSNISMDQSKSLRLYYTSFNYVPDDSGSSDCYEANGLLEFTRNDDGTYYSDLYFGGKLVGRMTCTLTTGNQAIFTFEKNSSFNMYGGESVYFCADYLYQYNRRINLWELVSGNFVNPGFANIGNTYTSFPQMSHANLTNMEYDCDLVKAYLDIYVYTQDDSGSYDCDKKTGVVLLDDYVNFKYYKGELVIDGVNYGNLYYKATSYGTIEMTFEANGTLFSVDGGFIEVYIDFLTQ